MASRSRTSTSAGPAVASSRSSKPQSEESAVSPPSLAITSSGDSLPVVSISRHSDRAPTRSRRASSRITSAGGASSSAVASAAATLTEWGSSSSAGRISPDACMSLVSSSKVAISVSFTRGRGVRALLRPARCASGEESMRRDYSNGDGFPLLLGGGPGGRRGGVGVDLGDHGGGGAATVLAARDDPAFSRVVKACSLLVDGVAAHPDDLERALSGPVRVDVLPPFAGGAAVRFRAYTGIKCADSSNCLNK